MEFKLLSEVKHLKLAVPCHVRGCRAVGYGEVGCDNWLMSEVTLLQEY